MLHIKLEKSFFQTQLVAFDGDSLGFPYMLCVHKFHEPHTPYLPQHPSSSLIIPDSSYGCHVSILMGMGQYMCIYIYIVYIYILIHK